MKLRKAILFCLIFLGLAACRATSSTPIPMATPTAVSPTTTPAVNEVEVEVTRIVTEQIEPTATPAPCTPLPAGMRLTISMAEEERTVLLDAEGLLPEDVLAYRLNGFSENHGSELILTLANPVGATGRHQERFYLGENDITEWSGQIVHQRGAVCFEFTFPLTEPVVVETAEPTPTPPSTTEATMTERPPATVLQNPVVTASSIIPGSWSPDGRFFAYSVATAENRSHQFYDVAQAEICPLGAYGLDLASRMNSYFWLPDGTLFVYGESVVAIVAPCGPLVADLTERFPEPTMQFVAGAPDHSLFLLASEANLWLYQFADHQVTAVSGLDPALVDGAAFSPDGRFVAFNGEAGGSYLLDVATATVASLATWQPPLGAGGQANPQWISNTQFVTRNSNDVGPLLIGVDGTVQNAGLAFWGEEAPPESALFALRDDDNGRFHLLLQTFNGDTNPLRLYHSETDQVEIITLEGYRWVDGTSNRSPNWLLIYANNEAGGKELLVRPVDPPQSVPQTVASVDTFLGIAQSVDHLAVGNGDTVDLWQLPDLSIVASYTAVDHTVTPGSFSPDGRFLTIIRTNPDGAQTLFIQPIPQP